MRQIEEMALAMASEVRTCLVECECKDCGWNKTDTCPLMQYTKSLAEKGYRKASDTITEFVERVKDWFCADAFYNNNYVISAVQKIADEMRVN